MKNIYIFMFVMNFQNLSLNLYKENIKVYNYLLMYIILNEYHDRGFIVKKIYKAKKRGTQVKFEKIKDYTKAKNKIYEIAKQLNLNLKNGE